MPKPDLRLKSTGPDLSKIAPELRPFAVRIDTLVPDPENARYHSTRNVRAIADSLRVFGQRLPLVARRSDRVVKVGNGRLEAMGRLGWEYAAVLFVPDDKLEAYAIADNRTGELAKWDYEKLLASIRADSEKGNLIGYIPSEIRELEKQVATLRANAAADAGKVVPPAVCRCPRCGHEFEEAKKSHGKEEIVTVKAPGLDARPGRSRKG